jgi:hypothetical protein
MVAFASRALRPKKVSNGVTFTIPPFRAPARPL